MKFFMFCKWEKIGSNVYDTFIGITAEGTEEAKAKLLDLVGDKSEQFKLFDIAEEAEI